MATMLANRRSIYVWDNLRSVSRRADRLPTSPISRQHAHSSSLALFELLGPFLNQSSKFLSRR